MLQTLGPTVTSLPTITTSARKSSQYTTITLPEGLKVFSIHSQISVCMLSKMDLGQEGLKNKIATLILDT